MLRCWQLSLPRAPRVPCASAVTKMSHNLPVPPLQAPSLLDMGVSRVTPVASLVFSKCLVVLPK